MKLTRFVILLVVFALVIPAVGCTNPEPSAKMQKVEDWVNRGTEKLGAYLKSFEGQTFYQMQETINTSDEPEWMSKMNEEKYPYDETKTMGDVAFTDMDVENGILVLYLKVPIGDEDRELAQQLAGNPADNYYITSQIIIETTATDLSQATTEDLKNITIKKVYWYKAELDAEE